jgi:predicted metalloprotease with PDZ domain
LIVAVVLCCTALARADEPNANAVSFATSANPMTLTLDARAAARGLMYSHLTVPVKPGPFTLVYPKWIPGDHAPDGPLNDLAALRISADGASLPWSRDPVDMYAFHVIVPEGVSSLDVDFDVLLNAPNDVLSSNHSAVVNWNRDVLYQQDADSGDVYVKASIILPDRWDFATALPVVRRDGARVDFAQEPLRTLIDSPLDTSRYAKHYRIWHNGASVAYLDVFADAPENVDLSDEQLAPYRRMVPEGLAMYGARHWNNYHSLVVLSDVITNQGIEHHESSDDRTPADYFSDPNQALAPTDGDWLMHEFSHSWNGKYRRPADLTTANYQIPMRTDLLWVYEGLNQYLGDVLSFRTGIRSGALFPDYIAANYASVDTEPGRNTTPLIDTATGAPYFYLEKGDYGSLRRSSGDFYIEGELIWLAADVTIRDQTAGKKSLDDFLHAFAGPPDTGPEVVTYTRADVEQLLSGVSPYDWHGFFQRYVYEISAHPPTDDLTRAGFRIVYTDEPNIFDSAADAVNDQISVWYSLGLTMDTDGKIDDVREASPAWKAGLAPGMKIVAVDQRAFSADSLEAALEAARHSAAPIAVLVNDDDWYRTYAIGYHGGPRHPHLQRIPNTPDMLAKIVAPRAR